MILRDKALRVMAQAFQPIMPRSPPPARRQQTPVVDSFCPGFIGGLTGRDPVDVRQRLWEPNESDFERKFQPKELAHRFVRPEIPSPWTRLWQYALVPECPVRGNSELTTRTPWARPAEHDILPLTHATALQIQLDYQRGLIRISGGSLTIRIPTCAGMVPDGVRHQRMVQAKSLLVLRIAVPVELLVTTVLEVCHPVVRRRSKLSPHSNGVPSASNGNPVF